MGWVMVTLCGLRMFEVWFGTLRAFCCDFQGWRWTDFFSEFEEQLSLSPTTLLSATGSEKRVVKNTEETWRAHVQQKKILLNMADSRVGSSILPFGLQVAAMWCLKVAGKTFCRTIRIIALQVFPGWATIVRPGLSIHFRQPIGLHRFASRGFGGEQYRSHPIPPEFWYALWGQSAGSMRFESDQIYSTNMYSTNHVPSWTCPNYEEHQNITERISFLATFGALAREQPYEWTRKGKSFHQRPLLLSRGRGWGHIRNCGWCLMVDQNVLCHL